MIVDLSFLAGIINLETVISGALAFFAGMAGVMVYTRLRNIGEKRGYHADDSVVEAVVLEYTRRLRDYDRMMAELRTKIDVMEIRTQAVQQPQVIMSPPQQQQLSRPPQPHVATVSEPVAVTQQRATVMEAERPENQNGTTDYILKLLAERPRTSREVQHAVGRTREHTARLMKKLHDSGLVSRDVNSKPFKYTITDLGLARLREKAVSEPPAAV
jgi:hypothetical protein